MMKQNDFLKGLICEEMLGIRRDILKDFWEYVGTETTSYDNEFEDTVGRGIPASKWDLEQVNEFYTQYDHKMKEELLVPYQAGIIQGMDLLINEIKKSDLSGYLITKLKGGDTEYPFIDDEKSSKEQN